MSVGVFELWKREEFRHSLVTALRGWNNALDEGWPEQLRAAGLLKQIFERHNSASPAEPWPATHLPATPASAEGLAQPRDRTGLSVAHRSIPITGQDSGRAISPETPTQTLDRLLDFPSHRLAVYGSLAPGKKNHHVIAGISGSWRRATLHGSLANEGWGAGEGFPGFSWDGSSTPVAAQIFSSPDLPHYWSMLDEFEGEGYRRILVPAEVDGGVIEICNVYALAKSA